MCGGAAASKTLRLPNSVGATVVEGMASAVPQDGGWTGGPPDAWHVGDREETIVCTPPIANTHRYID